MACRDICLTSEGIDMSIDMSGDFLTVSPPIMRPFCEMGAIFLQYFVIPDIMSRHLPAAQSAGRSTLPFDRTFFFTCFFVNFFAPKNTYFGHSGAILGSSFVMSNDMSRHLPEDLLQMSNVMSRHLPRISRNMT